MSATLTIGLSEMSALSKLSNALLTAGWLKALREFGQRHRKILSILSLTFVIGAAIYYIVNFPEEADGLSLAWAGIGVAYAALVMQTFNALEFRLQARAVGSSISFVQAQRIAVNAAIANLLPLPGSVLVRGAWLADKSSKKAAGLVLGSTALCWIGVSTFIAGTALTISGALIGLALATAGALLFIGGFIGLRRSNKDAALTIAGFEVLMTLSGVGLLWIAFNAVGFDISAIKAAATSAGGPLAGAVGVVPGGIGVSESLTALLAELVDTPASIGFLAASMRRIMNVVGLVIIKGVHEVFGKVK